MKKTVIIIIIISLTVSCLENTQHEDYHNLNKRNLYLLHLNDYSTGSDLYYKDSKFLITQTDSINNRIQTVFIIPHDTFNIMYDTYYRINGDSIFLRDEYCPLIDSLTLEYIEKTVYISDYDIENSNDEESLIYWNHNDGLICEYNNAMSVIIIYHYTDIINFRPRIFTLDILNHEKKKYPVPIKKNIDSVDFLNTL